MVQYLLLRIKSMKLFEVEAMGAILQRCVLATCAWQVYCKPFLDERHRHFSFDMANFRENKTPSVCVQLNFALCIYYQVFAPAGKWSNHKCVERCF